MSTQDKARKIAYKTFTTSDGTPNQRFHRAYVAAHVEFLAGQYTHNSAKTAARAAARFGTHEPRHNPAKNGSACAECGVAWTYWENWACSGSGVTEAPEPQAHDILAELIKETMYPDFSGNLGVAKTVLKKPLSDRIKAYVERHNLQFS